MGLFQKRELESPVRLLSSLLACLATMGCNDSGNRAITDLQEIQRQAQLKIPASARNVHFASNAGQGGPDVATYGRFELPVADLQMLLNEMPATCQLHSYDGKSEVMLHRIQESWWQPQSLVHKREVDWKLTGYSVNLLIGDAGDGDFVTVYFFNYEF